MSEENFKNFKRLFFIFVRLLVISVFFVVILNISNTKKFDEVCNHIGFDKYVNVNGQGYCSNDGINLFSVKLEYNFLGTPIKATKINLYNYGEQK